MFSLRTAQKIYDTTIEALGFASRKVAHILQLESKVRHAMFQDSIKRNNPTLLWTMKEKRL